MAKAILQCRGLLPTTPNCDNPGLSKFETVVYDSNNNGVFDAGEPIIVGPIPAVNAALSTDTHMHFRDPGNTHWVSNDPVFYDTNGTIAGRVFLAGPPIIKSDSSIRTDPFIKFVDANGNSLLDGVVAITARLEDLGGLLPDGTQQDVAAIQMVYNYDHTLLQAMRTTYSTANGALLSGQFDSWCLANPLTCNPAAGKYTYLTDNYCAAAGGSTLDSVGADDAAGKVSTSSLCTTSATSNFDTGLGCDPATRNPSLPGTCPGDITTGGVGALSSLDVLRVQFIVVGTGSTNINQIHDITGIPGTKLSDLDGGVNTPIPVALYNTTFSNGGDQPPITRFTYSPGNVVVGQSVSFDGATSSDSDGTVVSYQWNFFDGAPPITLTVPTVTRIFAAPGNYTVSLTVTDNAGLTDTTFQTINVHPIVTTGPVAIFTFKPSPLLINQTVTFNATLSYDPNSLPLTYGWNFGDGSTNNSNVTMPTHPYTHQGTFQVTLTVTNTHSVSTSTIRPVLVTRIPYLPGVKVGDSATFLVSGNSTMTQGVILATINVTRIQATNVTFTSTLFNQNGTTTHQLSTVNILVFNALLIPANIAAGDVVGAPFGVSAATINSTITGIFAGATRQANHLVINAGNQFFSSSLSINWDQTSGVLLGLNSTLSTGSGPTSTEQLVIVDTNIWPATQNRLPVPVYTWKPLYGVIGRSVNFNATRSYDPDAGDHIVSYHWDFGDGTSDIQTTALAVHTYSTPGNFTVTLTVTDTLGGLLASSRSITVLLPLIVVITTSPGAPVSDVLPLRVNFTSTVSGGRAPYAYSWDFGDGVHSTAANPSHTYSTAGSNIASLTVTDSVLGTSSISVTIIVLLPLSLTASASHTSGAAPLTIVFTAIATGGLSPYTYAWSAPGGSPTTVPPNASPFSAISVKYSLGGTYTASLIVTDGAGRTATTTISITLSKAPGTLTVLVTDSNGNNVQGAVVKLFSGTSYQTLVGQATTSSGGAADFSDLPPGDYSYQIIFGGQTINKTVTISEAASQSNPVSLSTAVQPTGPSSTNYLLYVGIAVAVIVAIAIAVLALRRRPLVSQ